MKSHDANAAHISVQWIGRVLFGALALISAFAFGGCVAMLVVVEPVGIAKVLLRNILMEGFFIASVFMLLATLSFWSCGSRWVDPLLHKLAPKAILVIFAFAIGICAMATVEMAIR